MIICVDGLHWCTDNHDFEVPTSCDNIEPCDYAKCTSAVFGALSAMEPGKENDGHFSELLVKMFGDQ